MIITPVDSRYTRMIMSHDEPKLLKFMCSYALSTQRSVTSHCDVFYTVMYSGVASPLPLYALLFHDAYFILPRQA